MSELFTRLLLATEHTEFDAGAESLAMELAHRCKVPLAAVFPLASNSEFEAEAPEIALKEERAAAAKIAQIQAAGTQRGITLHLNVRRGEELFREIVDEAIAQKSELIVIRRRGKRGFLANMMVGEMVTKVVSHTPCHLLIVPRAATMWQRHMLVAIEPTPQGQAIACLALHLASECLIPVNVALLCPDTNPGEGYPSLITELMSFAASKKVQLACELLRGESHSAIESAAKRCQADLIVLGHQSESWFSMGFHGSLAQRVIGQTDCPVLIIKPLAS
jgi:nucleotide-binding universal stress UspA family protein